MQVWAYFDWARDPWGLAMVLGAVGLGGFLRGFVGFGAALIIVPVLGLVFGPRTGVAITSLIGLPAVFQLLPEAVRRAERPVVLPVCAAIFAATPLGSLILVALDPKIMQIVISALVVAMVAFLARGWRLERKPGLPTLTGAGIAGGLVQGIGGIGGPPVVAVALARPGPPEQQRGNVLALMTAINLASLVPLAWLGLYTAQAVAAGLLLFPIYSLATAIGSRYFARGGSRHYRNAALATLLAVGLATLAAALNRYVAAA